MTKLIIAIGQSNCLGGNWFVPTTAQASAFARTKIWVQTYGDLSMSGGWEYLNYSTKNNDPRNQAENLGSWDLSMAEGLEAEYPSEDIYILKLAVGGRALIPASPNAWWARGGELRTMFLNSYLPKAINSIAHLSPEIVVIYDQGESDTALASQYGENLELLISDIREAVGLPFLPFIINGLVPKPSHPGFAALRAQQEAVAAADDNVHINNVDTSEKIAPDDSHFTTAGYNATGAKLVDLIKTLTLPVATPITPDDIHAANGKGYIHLTGADLADGAVTEWPNRFQPKTFSPNQVTTARKPTALGGVVTFDATDDGLISTIPAVPATFNYHCFFNLDPVTGNGCLMDLYNSVNGHRLIMHLKYSTEQKLSYHVDSLGWQGVALTSAQDAKVQAGGVFEYIFKDGVGKVLLNGETLYTGTYSPRQSPDQIGIGSRYNLANFYNGDMEDVVVFRSGAGTSPITDNEAAAIRSYLFYKD